MAVSQLVIINIQTGISFRHIPSPFHFQIQLFQFYIDLRKMRVGKLRKHAFCYLLQPNSIQHFSLLPFVTSSSLPQLLQPIHQLLHRYIADLQPPSQALILHVLRKNLIVGLFLAFSIILLTISSCDKFCKHISQVTSLILETQVPSDGNLM